MSTKKWQRSEYTAEKEKHGIQTKIITIKKNNSKYCVICGKEKIRKVCNNGTLERHGKYIQRLTCGNISGRKKSDCYKELWCRQNNPCWKEEKTTCEICGVLIEQDCKTRKHRACIKHAHLIRQKGK